MAIAADGLPPVLSEGLDVCVVPPLLRGNRWHTVLSAEGSGRRNGQLVALSSVADISAARELVGRHLLARVCDLPDDFVAHDLASLVGREVVDRRLGILGVIEEIMLGPANDVWVVRGGPFGEVLVPVVPQVVGEVRPEGTLAVDLPSGLVEEQGEV